MGIPLKFGIMGRLVILGLLAFLAGIQGASLPYHGEYEYHFNQFGVHMDLVLKDEVNPLVGGKAHVELPISSIWKMLEVDAHLLKPIISSLEKTTLPVWKLLEVEAPFLKPILIALEKNTLGRICDVMTLKADITYNAEEILKGTFNVAVDYTLVHKDGTEEKATLLIQEKNQGQSVTSVEIIPKNNVVLPEKKIFFPFEMIITCNWPSAHNLSNKGDFGKMFINIANDMNEVSVRGVLEYLGQQYKYSTILSIGGKYFTVTFQEPSKDLYDIVIKFNMINGFPRIEITGNIPTFQYFKAGDFKTEVIVNSWLNYKIKRTFHGMEVLSLKFEMLDGFPRIETTGNVPTTPLFTAGVFKSELIVKSLYNYEIKHVFKGMEMLNLKIAIKNGKMEMIMKYGQTHKTHIVLEYAYLRWIKILLPTTNTWLSKDLGVEMHYQPTNEAKLLEGGNILIVAKHDNIPVMKMGGYYGLTLDSTEYEILLNDFCVSLLNKEFKIFEGITFSELKLGGKILLSHLSMNGLLPKIAMEAKIFMDEQKVFHYLLTTIETPCKLHIFFPYLFQNLLRMTQGHIEITHEHVVLENEQLISILCNLTTKKIITTVTPTMMSLEPFDGEVSLVKYVTELTKVDVGRNSMLLEGNKIVQFNAYQPWFLPAALGFNQLKTKFHLEVIDKAEGKMNINVAVIKDTTEILNAVVNNVEVPYMMVVKAPLLPLEMKVDYKQSTKVWNIKINNRSILEVRPTVTNEVEVVLTGVPLFRVALLAKEVRITTIMKDLPEITTAVTLKTFSLFQNTLGIEVMVGKISHKTLLGWNINMLRKAFVDVKVIGSGIELLGDYEIFRHLNWNIVTLKNIDVEWTGKVLCTGLKFFKTPMVTEGNLLFKDYVVDMKMVEKLMNVPYTIIFKSHPLTVALLPFFQYP